MGGAQGGTAALVRRPRPADGKPRIRARDDGAAILRGAYFATDFKAFLAWRDFGFPDASVCNCFSMAALLSSPTAHSCLAKWPLTPRTPGSVYFAAGTPDPSDIFDGRVDLAASARRELRRRQEFQPKKSRRTPAGRLSHAPPRIACMKVMRIAATARSIKARVDDFLAADPDAELRACISCAAARPRRDPTARLRRRFLRHAAERAAKARSG